MKAQFTLSDLKSRGWTDSMIRQLLPTPDSTAPNPMYSNVGSPMKLYNRQRVETIEATSAYQDAKQKAKSRKAAARKAVETKRNSIRTFLADLHIEVPLFDREKLIENAQNNFYSLEYSSFATPSVERMCVNYLRHCETEYEHQLSTIAGKIGAPDAYFVIKEKVLYAIVESYDWLAEECERQIEEMEKKRWQLP